MARTDRSEFYLDDLWPKAFHRVDNGVRSVLSWRRWLKQHPDYMHAEGTMIYCGSQGAGKTLSAVRYLLALMARYPQAVVCTNVGLTRFPFNACLAPDQPQGWAYMAQDGVEGGSEAVQASEGPGRPIVEYSGLDCLKYLSNGYQGVIYLVDELHLELNSLESRNIDIDVIIEISQQRKQRKHIIGTSQQFMRLAKPLREQVHDVVLCKCKFGRLQMNKWIDASTAVEKDGKLEAEIKKTSNFWHTPAMYSSYDTYAKMKRYQQEWQGRARQDSLYRDEGGTDIVAKRRVRHG